jgi:hypothetical protein
LEKIKINFFVKNNNFKVLFNRIQINNLKASLGIGDWGLGIGDWGLGIGPNP